jgi:hypothetical protein
MNTRIILVLSLWLYALPVMAQQMAVLQGAVTDKTSGSPVAGAAVYVNNSTYTRICDAAGAFIFDRLPALPFDLTISAVGYETGTVKVTAERTGNLEIALQHKIVSLAEVKVNAPERDGWAKYGQQFMDELIGYSGYAAECTLLNKEVVQFHFNKEDGVLKAWSEQPLKIRNNATGYHITYWLEDFELDMFQKQLYYKGYAYFSELHTSARKAKRIAGNRQTAFQGSFYHFVRSLYKGNALAEGFEIRTLKRIDEDELGQYIPVWTDTLNWKDSAKIRMLFSAISGSDTVFVQAAVKAVTQWKEDDQQKSAYRLKGIPFKTDSSIVPVYAFSKNIPDREKLELKYYEAKAEAPVTAESKGLKLLTPKKELPKGVRITAFKPTPRKMDILYTALVPVDSIVSRSGEQIAMLHFPDCLQVTYIHEMEEQRYLDRRSVSLKPTVPGLQTSVLSLRNKEGVHLLENGNFYEAYDLLLEQYWSFEKLDKLMPLDYKP